MALNTATSTGIINALAKGAQYTFNKPYLGLFTTMPNADGSGFAEPTYPEYCRVLLTATGIEGQSILGNAATEAGSGDDADKLVAFVKNQELIYFPDVDTVSDDYSETIVGVGLFASTSAMTPYLWGALPADSDATIVKKSVPMVKIGNLKLIAK